MAQTTTAYNACDAVVELDDDAGVLQDISGSMNKVTFSVPANIAEFRTFGSQWPGRLCCGLDGPMTLNGWASEATDEVLDLLKRWRFASGAPCSRRTIRVSMPDGSAGSDQYTGEYLLENLEYDLTAGEGAPIPITATLALSGELDFTIIAS